MSAHPGGRPRALTPDRLRELLAHVAEGGTPDEAARRIGVSLRTVQREANENEQFGHDLQLALGAPPTDPYQLMLQAARTHWRAAAWLLERTDPDRFGKRPPNSCRAEQVVGLCSMLVEAALEFVPSEQRQLACRSLQAVADEAFDELLPGRRMQVPPAFDSPLRSDEDGELEPSGDVVDELADELSMGNAQEVLSPKTRFATKPETTKPDPAVIPAATPTGEEVLSPEMDKASEPHETATRTAGGLSKPTRAADRKASHVFERSQARRARRQAARAKRKGRKAA